MRTRLALCLLLLAGGPAAAGDNDNDFLKKQRREDQERAEFIRWVAAQQFVQNQIYAQQAAAPYLQALQYRAMLGANYPIHSYPRVSLAPGAAAETAAAQKERAFLAMFRETPGEAELEIGRLWRKLDAERAKALFQLAVSRSGDGSAVALQAQEELKNLAGKP